LINQLCTQSVTFIK
ncbi:Acyl-[acyl-carrier-protein]--UDP-N- acetylglucosamine O-acyltransferase, partial [Haemophilus influenzae]